MAGIALQDSLKINAPKPTDIKYLKNGLVAYASVAEAKAAIPQVYRYPGLPVLILVDGFPFEYWWRAGIADADLELKTIEYKGDNGTTIGVDGIVKLGGSLVGDTEISLVDHSFTFTNLAGTTPDNFYKVLPTGIEALYKDNSQTTSYKVGGDSYYYDNSVENGSSSLLNITKDFVILSSTDGITAKASFNIDNSNGATLNLKQSTLDGSSNRSIFATDEFIRIGTSGEDESVFRGLIFNNSGDVILAVELSEDEAEGDRELIVDSNGVIKAKSVTDTTNISLTDFSASIPSPPEGGINLYSSFKGDRLLAVSSPTKSKEVGWHPAFTRQCFIDLTWAGSYSTLGVAAPSTTGIQTFPSIAATNFLTQIKRSTYTSSASAGNASGVRGGVAFLWRGNAPLMGGFFFSIKFGFSVTDGNGILFAGLKEATTAFAGTTLPSNINNIIGVCVEPTETEFSIIRNDATGGATKETTNIPIKNDGLYQLILFCAPNSDNIYISLQDLSVSSIETGTFYETTVSDDLPVSTAFLTYHLSNANNTAAVAVACDFAGIAIDTNY